MRGVVLYFTYGRNVIVPLCPGARAHDNAKVVVVLIVSQGPKNRGQPDEKSHAVGIQYNEQLRKHE